MRRHLIAALAAAGFVTSGTAAAQTNTQVYTIATNPPGSIAYSAGSALAKILVEKHGLQFRIQPGAGSSTFVPQINRGEADFGISNPVEASDGFHGKGVFEGKPNPNYRLVSGIHVFYFGMIVAADNPAKTLADLKGKTLPTGYSGQQGMLPVLGAVLANAGLGYADFKSFPVVNQVKGTEALADGRVDTASHNPTAGAVKELHAKLTSRGGARFIDLDESPAAVARMRAAFPYGKIVTLQPGPAYVGITKPTRIMAYPIMLNTGAHVPDGIVETIVRILHDDKETLVQNYAGFQDFTRDMIRVDADMPYHPGAEKAFRALGLVR